MSTPREESFVIAQEMTNVRLDKLLTRAFPLHSRTYFQYLIAAGLVLVNGSRVKKREQLDVGDEIEVCFELTPEISVEPENIPLDILYEDDHLIAICKPAGMVTHPALGSPSGTFVNALLYHCKSLPQSAPLRPGIVHRLDKETTGVLIAAKTTEAHALLVELFSSRKITKHYLAICIGSPGACTIDAPIKRHPIKRQEMHVHPEGKSAISICSPIEMLGELALVDVQLVTGRTHQIRVHLKSKGTPILGDPVYGRASSNMKYGVHRQMLHAHRISLTHPVTGEPLSITAPVPEDMRVLFPLSQVLFECTSH